MFKNREFLEEWAGAPLSLKVTSLSRLVGKNINCEELTAMEIGAIRQFIECLWKKYAEEKDRTQKSKIIDAIWLTLGYNRKSIIRLLSSPVVPKLRRNSGSRKKHYTVHDESWLVVAWKAMGKICSERVQAALGDWLPSLRLKYCLPAAIGEKLFQMSPSTMDRLLSKYRARDLRKRNTGTVPSLVTEVALKPLGLKVDAPGVLEIDTVAHCGGGLSGVFAWTVTATDVLSGFTICRAIWGKCAAAVKEALLDIESLSENPRNRGV